MKPRPRHAYRAAVLEDLEILGRRRQVGMPRAPLLSGHYPKSWGCVDCGRDTAPGLPGRAELAELVATRPDVKMAIDDRAEIYAVRKAVWTAAP